MGIFSNLGHYDPQKLDTDFKARMAAADADIEFRADKKFSDDIKPYEEEVKETCEKCGRPVHRIVKIKEVHPSVRKFNEKMAEEDRELELKVNPPDLKERFRTEPMYIRRHRRMLRNRGVQEHHIPGIINESINLHRTGKGVYHEGHEIPETIAAGIGILGERALGFTGELVKSGARSAVERAEKAVEKEPPVLFGKDETAPEEKA
jgi:hypothetical protein